MDNSRQLHTGNLERCATARIDLVRGIGARIGENFRRLHSKMKEPEPLAREKGPEEKKRVGRITKIILVAAGAAFLASACGEQTHPHRTWDTDTETDSDTLCEDLAPEPNSSVLSGTLVDSVAGKEYEMEVLADAETAENFTAEGHPEEPGSEFSVVYDFGEYAGIPEYANDDTDNVQDRTDRHMVLITYESGEMGGHAIAEMDLENERVVLGDWTAWEELHVGQFIELGDDYFYRMNTVFQEEGDPEPCASANIEHPLGTAVMAQAKDCPGIITEYTKELDTGNKTGWYKIDLASTNIDGYGTIGIRVAAYGNLVELENETTMDGGETNVKVVAEPKTGPEGEGPKVLKQIKLWGIQEPCTDVTGNY